MSKVVCSMLVLTWGVALLLAATTSSVSGTASGVNGARSSYPRSNRGFKNAQLSTARGFGKRDRADPSTLQMLQQQPLQNFEGLFSIDNTRTSYPTSWLIEEIQTNPEVARLIVEKLIDIDGDGEVTQEDFRRYF